MEFEWDVAKAASNATKHGVDFVTAQQVFLDQQAIVEADHSDPHDERWRTIGMAAVGILFVVFAEADEDVIRIISARKATRHEQNRYVRQAHS